jgi:hypothetical protein
MPSEFVLANFVTAPGWFAFGVRTNLRGAGVEVNYTLIVQCDFFLLPFSRMDADEVLVEMWLE